MAAKTKTSRFDVADYLSTPEDCAAYLEASIEESNGDPAFIARALGDIARAIGMTKVAKATGLSRESLYKSLSGQRSPDFATVLQVAKAVGVRLQVVAA
jgi:probable addiction module antidote protein